MICDLYFQSGVNSRHLKFLKVFDKGFVYDPQKLYSGYLGVNIERIKMVSLILELRKEGVEGVSVPVAYRNSPTLDRDEGLRLARDYAELQGCSVVAEGVRVSNDIPLFWVFTVINDPEERAGGVIRVDRLDGHIWSALEYDEYMYDYNGLLG